MKKIIFISALFFIFTLNSQNIGNALDGDEMRERMINVYYENQREKMIQTIEYESEIKIPAYANLDDIEYMYNTANELQIPIRIVFRLVRSESSFIDTITSCEGAKGYMQLVKSTDKLYSEKYCIDTLNLTENQENIFIGLNLLKDLYVIWTDKGKDKDYSWALALASYNAGISRVLEYDGIPPFPETLRYIDFILREHSNPEFLANNIKKYDDTCKGSS